MTLHYHDFEQGSDEWLELRRGVITASEIKLLMTPKGKVANNDKSRAHVFELAAQRISGHIEPHYISDDMLRGMHNESIAREYYESKYGPVTERGFYILERDGIKVGYSPDGETFDGGLIEIKDRRQHHHVRVIMSGEAPEEHMLQMQAGLMVTGKPYIDYVQQCLGLPLFVKRVYPDEVMQESIWSACISAEDKIREITDNWSEITANMVQTDRPEDEEEVYLG